MDTLHEYPKNAQGLSEYCKYLRDVVCLTPQEDVLVFLSHYLQQYSSVFVMVGLSPLGAGFIPWGAVPMAIIGQIIVKTVMQLIGVGDLERFGGKTNRNCETCGKRMPLSVMSIYNPSTRCNRAGCNSENKFPLWEPSCGTQSK